MNKTILFVGGNAGVIPGIRTAREMGLHTVVSDYNPEAVGFELADDRLLASVYDVEETVEAARRYHKEVRPIHGVTSLATDAPLTVARVAESLGLPGLPVEIARLATDKLAMKDFFNEYDIPVPDYRPVERAEDLERLAGKWGFPLIVKPVDNRGARGVLRLTRETDLGWAFRHALDLSPAGRVIAEEFLEGPQLSTESLVVEGETYTPGVSDRNYEFLETYAPHIIENGGDLPSFLPEEMIAKARTLLADTIGKLGIENGVVKGDLVFSGGEPCIIELAFRMSGGYFCSHEIPLNTGVDFVRQAMRTALGMEVRPEDLKPKYQRNVCQRYFFPEPGVIRKVHVPGWVREDPGVALLSIWMKEGDRIEPPTHHVARPGLVITTGDSREEARERAGRVTGAVVFETE